MFIIVIVVFALMLGVPFSAIRQSPRSPTDQQVQTGQVQDGTKQLGCESAAIQEATVGDYAEGRQISESDSQELYIDTGPCTCKRVSFHYPYDKKVIGTVTCNGETFTKVSATQRKSSR
jgi:hypothetical protein